MMVTSACSAKEAAAAKKKRRKKKARGRTSETLSTGASAGDDGDQESIMSSSVCIESANGHDSDGDLPGTPAISEHSRQAASTPHGHASDFERHLGPFSSGEIPPDMPPGRGSEDGSCNAGHIPKSRSQRVSFDEGSFLRAESRELTINVPSHSSQPPPSSKLDAQMLKPEAHSVPQPQPSQEPNSVHASEQPTARSLSVATKAAGGDLSVQPKRVSAERSAKRASEASNQTGLGKAKSKQVATASEEPSHAKPEGPAELARRYLDEAAGKATMLLDIGPAAGEEMIAFVAKVSLFAIWGSSGMRCLCTSAVWPRWGSNHSRYQECSAQTGPWLGRCEDLSASLCNDAGLIGHVLFFISG